MDSWGVGIAILGAVILTVAELRMTRANAGVRMPAWRGAPVRPARVIALRALGAGLAVFGVSVTATDAGAVLGLIIIVWLPALLIHSVHNRQVAGAGRPDRT